MTFRARKKPIWTFTRRGYLASLSAKAARIWGWLMRKMGDVASFSIMNCTSFGIAPRRPFCSRTSKRHGVRGSAILGEMDDLGDKEPWHRTAPTPAIHCWHPERHRLWTVCFYGPFVFQDPVACLPLEVFLDEHAYTSMIDHGATRWRI